MILSCSKDWNNEKYGNGNDSKSYRDYRVSKGNRNVRQDVEELKYSKVDAELHKELVFVETSASKEN